jgi:L-2-hydroxyglutarate oxidase
VTDSYDIIVVGAGIVGLSTSLQLLRRYPKLKVAIIEKEDLIAKHQTGHNSGVIHSGIYYKPGSLKAKNCVSGVQKLLEFCQENNVPYEMCGKVIVATEEEELPRLEELFRRGCENGVEGLEMIGPERLKEIEPCANGIKALYSPNTGIVDYVQVTQAIARCVEETGGRIFLSHQVNSIQERDGECLVQTPENEFKSRFLINCAGLHSDKVLALTDPEDRAYPHIIPFRGEYYQISEEKRGLLNGLIYPVPDPHFPFLGVHLTRMINGGVEAGPNAVLALAREGYKASDISMNDCLEYVSYKGFWKMAFRYWKIGAYEVYRSLSKKAFLKDLQRLMPCLEEKDLVMGGSGVRAQAVNRRGMLLDDFSITPQDRMIHVINAPSPAATASFAVGEDIQKLSSKIFDLSK